MRNGPSSMSMLEDGGVIDYAPLVWNPADDEPRIPAATALWIAYENTEEEPAPGEEVELGMCRAFYSPVRHGWVDLNVRPLPDTVVVHYWARPPRTPPKPDAADATTEPEPEALPV